MRELIWADQAETDISKLLDEIARNDPDAEDRIFELILAAPEILREYPALGRAVGGAGVRKWSVRQTPYLLLYRAGENRLDILRVVRAMSDWDNFE